jgi:hypothetical protein
MSDNNNIISDPSDIRMNNIRIRSHIRRIWRIAYHILKKRMLMQI